MAKNEPYLTRRENPEQALTWSTGLVIQLEQYSLGLMIGKDYASEIGNDWEYHGKLWWSFGIGFVFLQ